MASSRMILTPDMKTTLELIKNFWPDFQCSNNDFACGKIDFVIRFYSCFVAEITDKLLYLINEETLRDEFDDIQDFDALIILSFRVNKIVKKLNYPPLDLIDFYVENPKKLYPFMKFCIHFVIYVNNCLDDVFAIVNEIFNKVPVNQDLKTMKQEILQNCAEKSEALARSRDILNHLKSKLEDVKKLYEIMTEEKIVQEKNCAEKIAESSVLQNEVDNLEYELKLLEDKEQDLKDSIIAEKDYESLRSIEKHLEVELQHLCSEDFGTDDNMDKNVETTKYLEEYAKKLSVLDFDSLDVEPLHNLEHRVKLNKELNHKIGADLNSLSNNRNAKEKKIENLNKTLEKIQSFFTDLTNKMTIEEENEQRTYEKEAARTAASFEECQRLETEIIAKREQIQETEQNKHVLMAAVAQEYQKILKMDKETTDKFHNALLLMIQKKGFLK